MFMALAHQGADRVPELPMQLIDNIHVTARRLEITVAAPIRRTYLSGDFFVEYSEDIGLDRMEWAIALAPFLLNVAPLVWFSNDVYEIDVLDADLAASLEDLRQEMKRLYPRRRWDGRLVANRLVRSTAPAEAATSDRPMPMLFTGGVDSTFTSICHHPSPQTLITAWGNETALDFDEKWQVLSDHCRRFAEAYGHQNFFIKTNAKEIIRRKRIGPDIPVWWRNIQHGMGMLGLCLPAVWHWGGSEIRIASTIWQGGFDGAHGSAPNIDERVRCAGISVVHDGFEFSRQGKLDYIVKKCRETDAGASGMQPPLCDGAELLRV